MKLNWKLKRADLERILIVCAAALVVVLALREQEPDTQIVYEESPLTVTQTSADAAASVDVDMQSTVCWYQDGDGYLVPVTRQIPQHDGIAKATLSLMVKSLLGVRSSETGYFFEREVATILSKIIIMTNTALIAAA